jgi:electron transport complex protein RnfB
MPDEVYSALADALDRLPNGFPRTESNVEIRLLKKIINESDAAIASLLSLSWEPPDAIAVRSGIDVETTAQRLSAMTDAGIVWREVRDGKTQFRLAPFIVGVYEAQGKSMDHELAYLVAKYMSKGGSAGIMGPLPALHRVVPAAGSADAEWILPYDDVRAIILSSKAFSVTDCVCRAQMAALKRRACSFALHNCLGFSTVERPALPGDITREQALAILNESEEAGLVHTVSNVVEGVSYVCNCCGCCCGILQGITKLGLAGSLAYANYLASIDAGECTGCGTCLERCQVGAIEQRDGISVVLSDKCIGCGLCVTGCAQRAVRLRRKPDAALVTPPVDFEAWERERLRNRGLA